MSDKTTSGLLLLIADTLKDTDRVFLADALQIQALIHDYPDSVMLRAAHSLRDLMALERYPNRGRRNGERRHLLRAAALEDLFA